MNKKGCRKFQSTGVTIVKIVSAKKVAAVMEKASRMSRPAPLS